MQGSRRERREEDIPREFYRGLDYDSLGRFNSYWHQIEEATECDPASILEIGVGNGFVARYLAENGFYVVTADLKSDLRPSVAANVCELPFEDATFDTVLCAMVLEHMVWEDAMVALRELARCTRRRLVVSVPDRRPALRIHVGFSGIGQFDTFIEFPIPAPDRFRGMDHEWELGISGYPVKRLTRAIREQGLALERTYRVLRDPTCRFFVATKDA